jgi:hypothetical protein
MKLPGSPFFPVKTGPVTFGTYVVVESKNVGTPPTVWMPLIVGGINTVSPRYSEKLDPLRASSEYSPVWNPEIVQLQFPAEFAVAVHVPMTLSMRYASTVTAVAGSAVPVITCVDSLL